MNDRTYVIRLEGLNTGSKGLSKRQTKGRKNAGVRDGLTKSNGAGKKTFETLLVSNIIESIRKKEFEKSVSMGERCCSQKY